MQRKFWLYVVCIYLCAYSGHSFAEPASEDTADTAVEDTAVEDTAIEDTSTLGDSAEDTSDTSDTADTSETTDTSDTSDTADTSDTSDTGVVTPASSLANEKGGFGCSKVGFGGLLAISIALLALFGRTREE